MGKFVETPKRKEVYLVFIDNFKSLCAAIAKAGGLFPRLYFFARFSKFYRLDSDALAGGGDCHPCHPARRRYAGSCADLNRQPVAPKQRHGVEIACLPDVRGVYHNFPFCPRDLRGGCGVNAPTGAFQFLSRIRFHHGWEKYKKFLPSRLFPPFCRHPEHNDVRILW